MKLVRLSLMLLCVGLMSAHSGAKKADLQNNSGFEDLGSASKMQGVSATSPRTGKAGAVRDLRCWGEMSWPEQREWMALDFRIYGPNNDLLVSMHQTASDWGVHHWEADHTIQVDASAGNTYRCRVDFILAGNTILVHNHYINY